MIFPKAVLDRYHVRRQNDLDTCRKSLATGDFLTIERVGHTLKGNGITFGFPELSLLGEALESSAQAQDSERIAMQLAQLAQWIANRARSASRDQQHGPSTASA